MFLGLRGRACAKTGWEVHAYCRMSNHWHAVLETAQGNLGNGMRWLLGTYTQSFSAGYLFNLLKHDDVQL